MTQQTLDPQGRAIPFLDEGEGPGLVLVPARGLGIGYLGSLTEELVDLGFRVLRVGPRRATEEVLTLHDLAQDVVDVMDHVGLADAWIGGHAFGGVVARAVAQDHLDRVGGVLLLGVETPGAAPDEADPEPQTHGDPGIARMQAAALDATPEAEWTGIAPVPWLAVEGVADTVTPTAGGDALKESAPMFVSLSRIDGASHLFPLTHPAETAEYIEDFLGWD